MQDCLAHPTQQKSLASLRSDHQAFQADGSRLPRAKFFNNVIRPALLPVDLDWVCVPALHLDLGIYLWLFEAMIAGLRELDITLAAELGKTGTQTSDSAAFAEAKQLKTTIHDTTKKRADNQNLANVIQSQVRLTLWSILNLLHFDQVICIKYLERKTNESVNFFFHLQLSWIVLHGQQVPPVQQQAFTDALPVQWQHLEAQEKNGKFRREKTNVQTARTSRQMDRQTDGQTDRQTIRQDR